MRVRRGFIRWPGTKAAWLGPGGPWSWLDSDHRLRIPNAESIQKALVLMETTAISELAKHAISPKFINVVAAIHKKNDAVKEAQDTVLSWFNNLEVQHQKKIVADFPQNIAEFSNLLAYGLLHISRAVQKEFAAESIKVKEINPLYREMIAKIPLSIYATIPFNHVLVYRAKNRHNNALQDTVYGCRIVSKYHYLLTAFARQYVYILLPVLRQSSPDRSDAFSNPRVCVLDRLDFMNSQMHNQNFRDRMEDARVIFRDHLKTTGDTQFLSQLDESQNLFDRISASAAASASAAPAAAAAASAATDVSNSGPRPSPTRLPFRPPPAL